MRISLRVVRLDRDGSDESALICGLSGCCIWVASVALLARGGILLAVLFATDVPGTPEPIPIVTSADAWKLDAWSKGGGTDD